MAEFFGEEGAASDQRHLVEFKTQVSIGVGRAAYRDASLGSRWPMTVAVQGPDHRTLTLRVVLIKRAQGNIRKSCLFLQ